MHACTWILCTLYTYNYSNSFHILTCTYVHIILAWIYAHAFHVHSIHVYLLKHIHVYLLKHIHVYLLEHIHVYLLEHIHLCLLKHIYVYIHSNICTYIYSNIYMYIDSNIIHIGMHIHDVRMDCTYSVAIKHRIKYVHTGLHGLYILCCLSCMHISHIFTSRCIHTHIQDWMGCT